MSFAPARSLCVYFFFVSLACLFSFRNIVHIFFHPSDKYYGSLAYHVADAKRKTTWKEINLNIARLRMNYDAFIAIRDALISRLKTLIARHPHERIVT